MSRWDRERPANNEIAAYAERAQECPQCPAQPGVPCERDEKIGRGRTVHEERFVAAEIALKRAWRADSPVGPSPGCWAAHRDRITQEPGRWVCLACGADAPQKTTRPAQGRAGSHPLQH